MGRISDHKALLQKLLQLGFQAFQNNNISDIGCADGGIKNDRFLHVAACSPSLEFQDAIIRSYIWGRE